MKAPKTNTQEILYTMIVQGHVSIFDFPYLSGFRTRVSELRLRYGLDFETIKSQRHNKFGNVYTYSIHRLRDKQKAVALYRKLISETSN